MKLRFPFQLAALSFLFMAIFSMNAPSAFALICPNGTPALLDTNDSEYCPASASGGSNLNTNTTNSPGSNLNTNMSNQATGDNSGTLLVNPLKNITSLSDLLDAVLKAILEIGTIVLILALIWVGFSFVRAQGNPKALAQARSALVWTIIGGAILLGAEALSAVIQSTVSNL